MLATLLLLERGAETQGIEGRKTPLTEAIRERRDESAKELLGRGAMVSAYALIVAARDGSPEMLAVLANPQVHGRKGPVRAGAGAGAAIRPPNKIRDAPPRYPRPAKEERIQGTVILEAIIDITGNVVEVRVLVSIPALDQAAIDAVKQWKYEPTLMDGVPVPIVMTVTVGFALT